MSQYVRINCEVLENVNAKLVGKAVAQVEKGLTLEPTMKHKGILRKNIVKDTDSVVCRNGCPIGIGFKLEQNNGKPKLKIIGDFWRSGFEQHDFTNKFCFNYQQLAVQQMQKKTGMTLIRQQQEEDGTLVLRYAC